MATTNEQVAEEQQRALVEKLEAHDDKSPGSSSAKSDLWEKYEVIERYDAKKQSWLSYFVAMFTATVLVGLFYYLLITLIVCLYYFFAHGSLIAVAVVATLIASTYYNSQVLWQGFIDFPIWRCLCEYLSFTVIIPRRPISKDERAMFVEFPHGVFPLGFMLSATVVQKAMKGLRVEGAIATVLFRIPLMRQLCHWFGSIPATDKNIRKILSRASLGIMAGGIAELFLSSRQHERVYVKNRRGFIKLALQTGTQLVPCYHFGNTQLFDFVGNEAMSRRLRTSILLFYGRFYLPIPYQHPVTMVIGNPIPVEKVAEPSKEQIDELQAKFIAALVDLFDTFKGEFGWADRKLEVC